MAKDEDLVPLFIPPLATLLGHAAHQKGARLTQQEVEAIRDKAPVIMMKRADAAKMAASRGFRDVEPENCWADWQRLRVEVSGDGYLPKHVLCVLGGDDLETRCARVLAEAGVEHDLPMLPGPPLRTVDDRHHVQRAPADPVDDDEGRAGDDEFTRPMSAAPPADLGKLLKDGYRFQDVIDDAGAGIVVRRDVAESPHGQSGQPECLHTRLRREVRRRFFASARL